MGTVLKHFLKWECQLTNHHENSVDVFQITRHEISSDSAIPHLAKYPEEMKLAQTICIIVFIVALFF